MQEIYSKTSSEKLTIGPKKETIDFLLNYSKAVSVINGKEDKFLINLN